MINANQIKTALANMMRMAARDPLWVIVAFISFPLRYAKSFLKGAVGYVIVIVTVYFGIDYLRRVILGSSRGDVIWHIGDWVFMLFAIVLLIRLLSVPLITHFGSAMDDTHGTARFAGQRAGTFLSNAGVLQVFGVNNHDSARLVSDLLGQETVVFNTAARALDSERNGLSFAEQHVAPPLLTPDEVRNMHANTELLFIAGQRPIVATKLRYYSDPEFAGLFVN
ncbi:type IV secretory system conjugative DNA transfer family protein (plasmid) [Rhizobium leguminosarum]|uniref:type IV secretory system conjugative DNA transfer family protein n=1 Tax=Rhizobium TaxID=379 RepID=UPI00103131C4|nr:MULTISPECIES: type IV secretory system conjugative DNA transfer family protein [Rhizobium]MBY5376916.1 type IV secretory system conjugative DNA transfer family protein [Rhizobium leguminosarum]TBF35151.1 type IV secretory system conjugative DNA transfer family protein [Rhizobium leguminosarum]TBF87949.1 type IV secretory system conjugative DNA transfer family protein [Rhizobium leguminosarum]WSH48695.1 type IV secretory system conjugative DNA transfer family protein [Rhizobium johnstonii]